MVHTTTYTGGVPSSHLQYHTAIPVSSQEALRFGLQVHTYSGSTSIVLVWDIHVAIVINVNNFMLTKRVLVLVN